MAQRTTTSILPVLFTCAASGAPVTTGYRLRAAELAAIASPRAFRCSAGGEIHTWTAATAFQKGPVEVV
jgi:hypothetical protein